MLLCCRCWLPHWFCFIYWFIKSCSVFQQNSHHCYRVFSQFFSSPHSCSIRDIFQYPCPFHPIRTEIPIKAHPHLFGHHRAPPGILDPVKRNLIGPLYRPAKKFMLFYINTMHFNDIFDYHSHICEKVLIVLHEGLIYVHNSRLTGGGFGFWVKKVHIWGFMVVVI